MGDAVYEKFYVASRKPGQAHAAMVADNDKREIKRFYREHAGAEIKIVGRDDMEKMLRAYVADQRSTAVGRDSASKTV